MELFTERSEQSKVIFDCIRCFENLYHNASKARSSQQYLTYSRHVNIQAVHALSSYRVRRGGNPPC